MKTDTELRGQLCRDDAETWGGPRNAVYSQADLTREVKKVRL